MYQGPSVTLGEGSRPSQLCAAAGTGVQTGPLLAGKKTLCGSEKPQDRKGGSERASRHINPGFEPEWSVKPLRLQ